MSQSVHSDEPQAVEDWDLYVPGLTVFHPEPSEREVRNVFYLVAYDICCHKRLRKVAKVCEEYGVRVEKSVFECDLPQEIFERLWCELIDLAVEDEDAIVAYRLCKSCVKETESIGIVPRMKERLFYFL
mgnify:CR=1 FL=1